MKFLLVCVNYNSYESLNKYLLSIDKAFSKISGENELDVVVADNSETIKDISNVYCYNLFVFPTHSNLGYFGGITYGIRESKFFLKEFDYIFISNVDLCMHEDFFCKLEKHRFKKEIGCIAPTIESIKEKRNRNPKILKRPSRKKMLFQSYMYKYPIIYNIYTKYIFKRRKKNKNNIYVKKYIYAPHGSFMIFTNKFADFLQEMKYPEFLFGEEIFIAENLRLYNLLTVFLPELCIYDSDHISTSKIKKKTFYLYNYKSMCRLIKDYFNE